MKNFLSNKIIIFILIIILIVGITTISILMNNKVYSSRSNDNSSTTTTNHELKETNSSKTSELESTTIREEKTSIVSSKTNKTTEKSSTKNKVISKSSAKKTTSKQKQTTPKSPVTNKTTTEKKTEQEVCLTELEKNVPLYYDLGCGMRAEEASFELAMHWGNKGIDTILTTALVKEMDACDEIVASGCHDVTNAEYIAIKGTNNKYLRGYAIKFIIYEGEIVKRLAEGYIKSDNTLQWIYKKY